LAPEPAIDGSELATDITSTNNKKVGGRMNPLEKFVAIDEARILGTLVVRSCPGCQDDVVRINLLVLLMFGRNPNSIFIDQSPMSFVTI
jgi:hypothetical protein